MSTEKDVLMEFALEKPDMEPKTPVEEPIMFEALVEVPTDGKALNTAEPEPMLGGINLATEHLCPVSHAWWKGRPTPYLPRPAPPRGEKTMPPCGLKSTWWEGAPPHPAGTQEGD